MRPSQQREFVKAIKAGAKVTVACERAGVSRAWAYEFAARSEGASFRIAWAEADVIAAQQHLARERRRVAAELAHAS